ncbi:MAG TPA: twin-arginine translocation signal domain-containing protein [Burkholderiales bacterium]|nr:twin-arginine translocation signal domain-containing protein [Burkholderiales bacterium]
MAQKKAVLSRRNFLLTIGAGGAAAAAAVVGQKTGTPAPAGADKRATSGYKVTEHVSKYYRTAKV